MSRALSIGVGAGLWALLWYGVGAVIYWLLRGR